MSDRQVRQVCGGHINQRVSPASSLRVPDMCLLERLLYAPRMFPDPFHFTSCTVCFHYSDALVAWAQLLQDNKYVPFAWFRNRDWERTFQSNIGDSIHELGTCRSHAGKESTYELTAFCASQPWVLSTRIAVFRSSCVKFWNCVMAAFCCELYTAGILC